MTSAYNKVIKQLLRIIFITVFITTLLYFGLWVFIAKNVSDELKQQYSQNMISNFSDNQFQLMWYVLTGNKNYRFTWYPPLIEVIGKKELSLGNTVAAFILHSNGKYRNQLRLKTWNLEYGLARYIKWDNDYKRCVSVIISHSYLGDNIFGFANASNYYYEKNTIDLTERELISIVLLSLSPVLYKIESEYSERKIEELIYNYYK